MITLQLKRTVRNLSDNKIKNLVLENGEPLLVESNTNTSIEFTTNCASTSEKSKKLIFLNDEQSDLFIVKNDKPLIGTTLFVTFADGNTNGGLLNLSLSVGYALIFEYGIRYISGGEYKSDIYNSQFNWNAGDTRIFVFDGTYWVIQLPSDHIENSILFIGNGKDNIDYLYESGTYVSVSKYISDDMIKNGSITIKKLDPDIDLASKGALQQIEQALEGFSEDVENNFNEVDEKINLNKIYYTTCSTPSNSSVKYVNVADLKPQSSISKYDGLTLVIKFTNGVNILDYEYLKLQVRDSTGNTVLIDSKPLYVGNNRLSKAFYWQANDTLIFVFNATFIPEIESGAGVWNMASTSASSVIANWCYNNNTTMINGATIATGTISANSIEANSITADQIAVGALPTNVFDETTRGILTNLNQFRQQCASAGAVVVECETSANEPIKLGLVTNDTLSSISTKLDPNNAMMPLAGTSVVVKFNYANTYTSQNGITFALSVDNSSDSKFFEAPLGFFYKEDVSDVFINIGTNNIGEEGTPKYDAIMYYRWENNSYVTLMFDGLHWVMSNTTDYLAKLADYCLQNDQTWIGGGTIITGTISADQIQSGSIDTSKVALVCYGLNDAGDVLNWGGLGYFEGGTGQDITRGIWIYGATPIDDPDGKPDYSVALTNEGIIIKAENSSISCWNNIWNISATRGIKLTAGDHLNLVNLPTSSSGLNSGDVYSDGGTLKIKT